MLLVKIPPHKGSEKVPPHSFVKPWQLQDASETTFSFAGRNSKHSKISLAYFTSYRELETHFTTRDIFVKFHEQESLLSKEAVPAELKAITLANEKEIKAIYLPSYGSF